MPDHDPTEKDYHIALKAALAIDAVSEALDALMGLAQLHIAKGETQTGANLLLFVMNHPDVRHDTFDHAEELFLELETHVCPRVIADARAFVLGKSLATVAAHLFAPPGEG